MDTYDESGLAAFDRQAARSWAGFVPWWVPQVLLIAGWGIAFALAALFDTRPCSPQDPGICGPDQTFNLAAVALLATPVLLWFMPRLGCAAGVLFAALDVLFDPVDEARIAFGVHGLACLVVLIMLTGQDRRQVTAARTASGPGTRRLPAGGLPDLWPFPPESLLVGAVLLAGGAASIGWFAVEQAAEAGHLARAVAVTGTVRSYDADDYVIAVDVPEYGPRRIGVLDGGPYPEGASVPVLVDPADPSWTRAVAEPADPGFWLSAGLTAVLLGLVLIREAVAVRRWMQHTRQAGQPAVRVLIETNGMDTWIYPVDAGPETPPLAISRRSVACRSPVRG